MADGSCCLTVTVRYFAAARAAAGVPAETVALPGPATVGDVLGTIAQQHGPQLEQVLTRCSYLLRETAVHGDGTAIRDGDTLDVLPPFAGG